MGTAILLHAIVIFAIMVPSFVDLTRVLRSLTTTEMIAIIAHAVLGSVVEVMGIYIVCLGHFAAGMSRSALKTRA